MRFADLDLREEAWSPLEWVYLLGGELADWSRGNSHRWRTSSPRSAGRLDQVETVVDAAIEEIEPVDERPVARFHTEKALDGLPAVIELADETLKMAEEVEAEDPAVAAVLPRLVLGSTGMRRGRGGR